MNEEYSKFLEKVAREAGLDPENHKVAFGNFLANPMYSNMIDAALKSLEVVSMASLDIKLVSIVKLLQALIKEKQADIAKEQYETQYGHGSYQGDQGYQVNTNPYGTGTFY